MRLQKIEWAAQCIATSVMVSILRIGHACSCRDHHLEYPEGRSPYRASPSRADVPALRGRALRHPRHRPASSVPPARRCRAGPPRSGPGPGVKRDLPHHLPDHVEEGQPQGRNTVAAEAAGAGNAGMSGMIRSVTGSGSAGSRGVSTLPNGSFSCDRHSRSRCPESPSDKTLMAQPATPQHESGPASRSGLSWERGHLARNGPKAPAKRRQEPHARATNSSAQGVALGVMMCPGSAGVSPACPCGGPVAHCGRDARAPRDGARASLADHAPQDNSKAAARRLMGPCEEAALNTASQRCRAVDVMVAQRCDGQAILDGKVGLDAVSARAVRGASAQEGRRRISESPAVRCRRGGGRSWER